MMNLLLRVAAIVVMRAGPQDLPASRTALTLVLLAYALVAGGSIAWSEQPPERPLVAFGLYMLLPLVLIAGVLGIARKTDRCLQTTTALFGAGALLSAMVMALVRLDPAAHPPVAVAALMLYFWHFAVDAHIWRHALEVSFTSGLLVTVVLFAISFFTVVQLAGLQ